MLAFAGLAGLFQPQCGAQLPRSQSSPAPVAGSAGLCLGVTERRWSVVLAGRRTELLEETASPRRRCREPRPAPPDQRRRPGVLAALFRCGEGPFRPLDLLFNNAGTGAPPVPLEEPLARPLERVVDINLTGGLLCTQAAFRLMKDQDPRGGRIINNGSLSAHAPRPRSVAYTATKHAITGLTRSCLPRRAGL